jgi:hypothetical protein
MLGERAMTEAGWWDAADPTSMLEFLRGRATDRKLRLFACACVRRALSLEETATPPLRRLFVQPHHPEEYQAEIAFLRHALRLSEQRADGVVSETEWDEFVDRFRRHPVAGCPGGYELTDAAKPDLAPVAVFEFLTLAAFASVQVPADATAAAHFAGLVATTLRFLAAGPGQASRQVESNRQSLPDPVAAYHASFRYQIQGADGLYWVADEDVVEANGYAVLVAWAEARKETCGLLREVFSNPLRSPTPAPSWLTPTVIALATGIYADRAFDRMPILADALEDAGCEDANILSHCRGDGAHVRGCWVIDLLLGKE